MATEAMRKAQTIRELCAVHGITLELARQAHANYEERVSESQARLARAEESAAHWGRIVQAFEYAEA